MTSRSEHLSVLAARANRLTDITIPGRRERGQPVEHEMREVAALQFAIAELRR